MLLFSGVNYNIFLFRNFLDNFISQTPFTSLMSDTNNTFLENLIALATKENLTLTTVIIASHFYVHGLPIDERITDATYDLLFKLWKESKDAAARFYKHVVTDTDDYFSRIIPAPTPRQDAAITGSDPRMGA